MESIVSMNTTDSNNNANQVRRSILPQTPYPNLQQHHLRQQQQQLQYMPPNPMSNTNNIHPMGMNMAMNMQQTHVLPADSTVTPYWRSMMIDTQHAVFNYQHKGDQPNHLMNLEYSEFLHPTRGSNKSPHNVSSNGEASPFATTSSTAVTPLYSKPPMESSKPNNNNYLPNGASTELNAAVRPASNTIDKSQAKDDPCDEPDLTQHKIEFKNEPCHYHKCPNRARVSQLYGHFCNRHVIVAPCGFPGCRDRAMVKASMCDKHLNEGKDALHRILATRAQNIPVCRTFGCFKNDQGRGYCRGHEKLLMAIGRLPKHINKRRLNSAYTMCSYPNCNKHSQRHHLCRTHGNILLKQAQDLAKDAADAGKNERVEDILARLQKDIRACTHPSCTKNSQRDRLCTTHYYEKMNRQRGEPITTESTSHSMGNDTVNHHSESEAEPESDCHVNGCNNQAISRGLCKFHSQLSASKPKQQSHARCSIQGCGQMMLNESGFCGYHSTDPNQRIMGQVEVHNLHQRRTNPMDLVSSHSTLKPTTMPFFPQPDIQHNSSTMFSPLVPVGDMNNTAQSNHPLIWQGTSTPLAPVNREQCRTKNCDMPPVRGGLCEDHFRSFSEGSLSVDQIRLHSFQSNPLMNTNEKSFVQAQTKKYFCKVDSCDKQVQKQGYCKRHFRIQSGEEQEGDE